MKACGCVAVYTETLQIFLHALDTPVHRPMLHAGMKHVFNIKYIDPSHIKSSIIY